MNARHKPSPLTFGHILIIAFGIGTATGWGTWYFSDQRAEQLEQSLREQVSTLAQRNTELLHEQTLAKTAKTDLTTLQPQVTSAREELTTLLQSRDQAQAELAMAQSNLSQIIGKATQDQADAPDIGSTASSAEEPQEAAIASAQRALSNLGYGPISADGVLGPGTRQAIEAFQYKNSLPVTRELDAPTLRRLTGGDAIAAAQ